MTTLPLSLRQRRAYVDSSAYLALLDRTDPNHAQAVAIAQALARERYRQLTTNIMVIECHALLLSHMGMAPAGQYLHSIQEGNTVVVRVREQDEERGKAIVWRYTDKDFSLADAISFVVMERLGITRAFTFDRHFAQYGFTPLTPEHI